MRRSLRGHSLPENLEEYQQLRKARLLRYAHCFRCDKSHEGRTTTPQAWAETQISGMCEVCWDNIFKEQREDA